MVLIYRRFACIAACLLLVQISLRSQEFGPWSHWDIDHTMCPKSWPSIVNPLPLQNGHQLRSVETYKWSYHEKAYYLHYSDSCWWPANDSALIFRELWTAPYSTGTMFFTETPENQGFYDINRFPYRIIQRDRYGRDSMITICTEVCGEILFRTSQMNYDQNGMVLNKLIKTRYDQNTGDFNLDSISYSYILSNGRIIQEIQRHYLDQNYQDSILYVYDQDRLLTRLTYRNTSHTVKYSFCNYDYYTDSLAHTIEVEGLFNPETGRPDTASITDRGYDRAGFLRFQRDIPSYSYSRYMRHYFINYNDQGLIKEWIFLEGDQNPVPNRKIVFHWFNETSGTGNSISVHAPIVFPNPAIKALELNLNENRLASIKVTVLDMTGKILINKNLRLATNNIRLDISELHDGLYLLVIQDSKGITSARFLKSSQ